METHRWTNVLSRIDPRDAHDIDDIASAFDPRAGVPGRDIFPEIGMHLISRAAMKRVDEIAVGLRVTEEPPDAADRALRIAAFAVERDVEVIVLSHTDRCGFERFGFRVERIAGESDTARAACEDQIRRFWGIDLVL